MLKRRKPRLLILMMLWLAALPAEAQSTHRVSSANAPLCGNFLIDRYAISLFPGGTVLVMLKEHPVTALVILSACETNVGGAGDEVAQNGRIGYLESLPLFEP